MHSPLSKHLHPMCIFEIDMLNQCHQDNPWLKFFGVCNEPARVLTKCFQAERAATKERNLREARKEQQLLEKVRSTN